MIDGFEIKCQKCGNIAIDIKGTATLHGAKVRVNFTCLSCGYETEVPVTQKLFFEFEEDLKKKSKLGVKGVFINLYEDQLDCVGKKDIDDALEYFSAKKSAQILGCEVEELMEFSTESIGGKGFHEDVLYKGERIRIVMDEFDTDTLWVYKYKGVLVVLNLLDDIPGGLIREKDIPKVL